MSKSNEPEKRRFQFRLRSLLIAMGLASLLFAYWRTHARGYDHEQAVLDQILTADRSWPSGRSQTTATRISLYS